MSKIYGLYHKVLLWRAVSGITELLTADYNPLGIPKGSLEIKSLFLEPTKSLYIKIDRTKRHSAQLTLSRLVQPWILQGRSPLQLCFGLFQKTKPKQNHSVHFADGSFVSLTQAHATHAIVVHKGKSLSTLLPCPLPGFPHPCSACVWIAPALISFLSLW